MSSENTPITPARFAEALKALSLSSLHLKVLELRNQIAHLDYSNEQLRPFAEGREAVIDPTTPSSSSTTAAAATQQEQGDQDCKDAIAENEGVIERMQDRIKLIRVEVEERGCSWTEFQSKEELEDNEPGVVVPGTAGATSNGTGSAPLTNGVNGHSETNGTTATTNGTGEAGAAADSASRNPWTDGTFQMGTIRNGEIHMDANPPVRPSGSALAGGGGRLTDEELQRLLEARLAEDEDDDEGGMHL